MPHSLRLCGRVLRLSVPPEVGAGLDFIDIALDDDYGLRDLPFQPRTILDIGANFGLFSLLTAHYVKGVKIHAYEPNPRTFPYAAHNLSLINGTAFEAGVGAQSGSADIVECGDSRTAKTSLTRDGRTQIVILE